MTVYADVLFLMNFLFDAEILFLVGRIYSIRVSVLKILLSATVGGLCGVLVFVPNFEVLSYPPTKLVLPAVMTAMVFVPCKRKTFVGATLIFCGATFFVSGAINFFGIKGVFGLLMPVPAYGIIRIMKKNTGRKRSSTLLCYKGQTCIADGFCDSGNMLESFGAPVILGDKKIFERLFGKGFSVSAISEWVEACDVRIVPYASFGKTGAAIGVKLDYVEVCGRKYHGAVMVFAGNELSEELVLNSAMI